MRLSILRLLVPAFLVSQALALPTSKLPSLEPVSEEGVSRCNLINEIAGSILKATAHDTTEESLLKPGEEQKFKDTIDTVYNKYQFPIVKAPGMTEAKLEQVCKDIHDAFKAVTAILEAFQKWILDFQRGAKQPGTQCISSPKQVAWNVLRYF